MSLPIPKAIPSCAKAIHDLVVLDKDSLFDTMKLKPRNEFTSPLANALTVLKSELVTSVVPKRSVICLGHTMMCLGIEGSTSPRSRVCLAVLNLAIVKPAEPCTI